MPSTEENPVKKPSKVNIEGSDNLGFDKSECQENTQIVLTPFGPYNEYEQDHHHHHHHHQVDIIKSITKPETERDEWTNPIEFLLSCVALSVGLGNIWRFPYVAYQNGGGAFLIPYFLVLTFVGRPFYFLEFLLGQFSSRNHIHIWDAVPAFRGVGYAQSLGNYLVTTYYAILNVLSVYYLCYSFQDPLPWTYCYRNLSASHDKICVPTGGTGNLSSSLSFVNSTSKRIISSTEEFFTYRVLKQKDSIEDGLGIPDLTLMGFLALIYCVLFLILWNGVHSSGKVAYFTAIFPYVVLFSLVVRGVTLEGAGKGITFYLYPKWEKLLDPQVWYSAVGQCFFSLTVGYGSLQSLASYNSFRHNCYRDAWIISIVDTFTSFIAGFAVFSILGNLSEEMGVDIEDVVNSGTSLAFISYTMAISKFTYLPQLFSVMFFLMLLTLGLGSLSGLSTGVLAGFIDSFPILSKQLWCAIYCLLSFLFGLVYITPGGQYILSVVDNYGGILIIYIFAVLEVIGWAYIYGIKRLIKDAYFMINLEIGIYWKFCWGFTCPLVVFAILVYQMVQWTEPSYNGPIPAYALNFGRITVGISVSIFLFCFLYCRMNSDSWSEIFTPNKDWGPLSPKLKSQYLQFMASQDNPPLQKEEVISAL